MEVNSMPAMHSLVIDLGEKNHPKSESEFSDFGRDCERRISETLNEISGQSRHVFGAVHGLTFPADMQTETKLALNQKLADCYHRFEIPVLGGDTSNGPRFQVVVTFLSQPN